MSKTAGKQVTLKNKLMKFNKYHERKKNVINIIMQQRSVVIVELWITAQSCATLHITKKTVLDLYTVYYTPSIFFNKWQQEFKWNLKLHSLSSAE